MIKNSLGSRKSIASSEKSETLNINLNKSIEGEYNMTRS